MLTPAQLDVIFAALDADLGLDTLWVHGSEAKGTARPDSDLDLAGLFRTRKDRAGQHRVAFELSDRLGRTVDLVDFDTCPPTLAMQILRHGRLLHDSNPRRRAEAVIRTLTAYADLKLSRAPIEAALVRWSLSDARS